MGLHFGGMAYVPVFGTGKIACNSLDGTSVFGFETLKSCGVCAAVGLCPQGIACENTGRVCDRLGVTTVRRCRMVTL